MKIIKIIKKLVFLFFSILLFNCSKPAVLMQSVTENGGIYYYEDTPFDGIGFSNWTSERRKESIEFDDGKIKSIVRYFENKYRTKPIDSLVFDEDQNLIYQKRWIQDDLFIEKIDFKNQLGPGDFENTKNEQMENKDILSKLDDIMSLIAGSNKKIESINHFKTIIDSASERSFIKFLLKVNKSNHIPNLLSGQRYSGDNKLDPFDEIDYHFQGAGAPQIDGRYVYIDELYIYPEFGYEGTVPGFNIHTRYIDEITNKSIYTKYYIEDPSYYLRNGEKNKENLDKTLNSFYHINEISENRYEFYIRPYTLNKDRYNDPFKPIYYVFDIDFESGKFYINYYSSYHSMVQKLFLVSTEEGGLNWLGHTPYGFYSKSYYDKKIPRFNKTIEFLKELNDPDNIESLEAAFQRYQRYQKSLMLDNKVK